MDMTKRVLINGDCSAEMVSVVSNLLNEQKLNTELELGNLSKKTAHFMLTPDMLYSASAIAAVLSFLVTFWKMIWPKYKKTDAKKVENKYIALLESQLQLYKAEGFEIESIMTSNNKNLSENDKIVITVNNVPRKKSITIDMDSSYHINIEQ